MKLLYPICYPLSKLLDYLLGVHSAHRYHRKDLKALLELHVNSQQFRDGLTHDEASIIKATIDLRDKQVHQVNISMDKVFVVSDDDIFNDEFVNTLQIKGFSRVPVIQGKDKTKVLGTFTVKSLLKLKDTDYNIMIKHLIRIQDPLIVY